MKTVIVTTEAFETIPGKTTKKTPAQWKGGIDTLLYQLDELPNVSMERKAWLSEKASKMDSLLLELIIQVELETGPVERRLSFELEPVLIKRKKWKSSHKKNFTIVEEINTSWKLFHDLLQAKLASARLGTVEIHHEFMPYIKTQLPDGSMGNYADFMNIVLAADELNAVTQLEHIPDEKRRSVIEASYSIKDQEEPQ